MKRKQKLKQPGSGSEKNEPTATAVSNEMTLWQRSAEYHRMMAEWYRFQPWEGIQVQDLLDFAMYGELVAQCYLHALRKAVPELPRQRGNYFERLLLAHIGRLNEMLCELAREGRWGACNELWDQALKLTETFSELAVKQPTVFRAKARQSLFMPSIRTRNPRFTADAKAIAEAIELSAETVGGKLTDNRVRLGALCARLVAECVHEIRLARDNWVRIFTQRQQEVPWPTREQIQPLRGKSAAEIITGRKTRPDEERYNEKLLLPKLEFFCVMGVAGPSGCIFLFCRNSLRRRPGSGGRRPWRRWWKRGFPSCWKRHRGWNA